MSNETKEQLETIAGEETALQETGAEALEEDSLPAAEDGEALEDGDEDEYEYETEDGGLEEVVHAVTQIDGPLLDVIARVSVEQTPKKTRMTYLVLGVIALPAAILCVMQNYTIPGCILAVLAAFLLQSWYACSERVIRKRIQKSEGLHWDYTVDKHGVHVGKTVNDRCIGWNLIKRGWLEGDLYLMEVQGTIVAIRRSTLSDSERNLLELLMLENLKKCTL